MQWRVRPRPNASTPRYVRRSSTRPSIEIVPDHDVMCRWNQFASGCLASRTQPAGDNGGETVEDDETDRDGLVTVRRQGLLDALLQLGAVGQVGEHIVLGHVGDRQVGDSLAAVVDEQRPLVGGLVLAQIA